MAAVTQRRKTKRTNVPGLYRVEPSRVFPDGGYEVRYRDADYRTRRKTFRTKQDALDFQASVRTDKNRGDFIDPRKAATRFGEVADKWFEGTAHLRPTTRAAYRSMLKTYIKPGLGDYPIGKITPSVLRAFMAGLPDGLSATRKRHVFRTLVPIFKLAVDDGMIRMSPTGAASVKGSVPKAVRRNMLALTAEQVASVAEAVTPRYRVLVYFAAYTGMRAGEITGLPARPRTARVERSACHPSSRRCSRSTWPASPTNPTTSCFRVRTESLCDTPTSTDATSRSQFRAGIPSKGSAAVGKGPPSPGRCQSTFTGSAFLTSATRAPRSSSPRARARRPSRSDSDTPRSPSPSTVTGICSTATRNRSSQAWKRRSSGRHLRSGPRLPRRPAQWCRCGSCRAHLGCHWA